MKDSLDWFESRFKIAKSGLEVVPRQRRQLILIAVFCALAQFLRGSAFNEFDATADCPAEIARLATQTDWFPDER